MTPTLSAEITLLSVLTLLALLTISPLTKLPLWLLRLLARLTLSIPSRLPTTTTISISRNVNFTRPSAATTTTTTTLPIIVTYEASIAAHISVWIGIVTGLI